MNKLSNINESVWSDIHKRSTGTVIKKEDGRKVSTNLGVDIYIKDSSCNYNHWITEILNKDPILSYGVCILDQYSSNFTPDEMVNIRKWEAPYDYLINNGIHNDFLVADFDAYDNLVEHEDDIAEEVSEDDYISICKGIATKLKEVGEYFAHVPSRYDTMGKYKTHNQYTGDYILKLIDESAVAEWVYATNDMYNLNDYMKEMIAEFPELEYDVFILWSFHNEGSNIGIPMNFHTLIQFQKYKEFTKKWFKEYEETE